VHLALLNQRRELALKFLLEPQQLTNLVKTASLDARVLFAGTGQAAANLQFNLFFDAANYYSATTNAKGELSLGELPLGACILMPADPKFGLTLAALKKPLKRATFIQVASGLAQGLLKDLRRKTPVLDAYLLSFPTQEKLLSSKLASYLNTMNITSNAMLSEAIRRDCLGLLGVLSSQNEANRRPFVLAITQV
ncbi:MAG TPA: hypothetical protein PLM98_12115, partial [Thiolinea sp.]|nr:hypothetical protein [Thiolinea sp.]